MDTPDTYTEPRARMLRYYERLSHITRGCSHENEVEGHADDFYAFFLHCYHLKDWLANDRSFEADPAAVEAFVSGNDSLRICADICTGARPLRLTGPRGHERAGTGGRVISSKPGGAIQISIRFTVGTDVRPRDAFDLATACVELWRGFLARFGGSL